MIDASAKKAPAWFTNRGLQLPKLVQTKTDAYKNSIPQPEESVNTFDENSSDNLYSLGDAENGDVKGNEAEAENKKVGQTKVDSIPKDGPRSHSDCTRSIAQEPDSVNSKFRVFKNPICNPPIQAKILSKRRMQNKNRKGECPKGLLPMPQVLHLRKV